MGTKEEFIDDFCKMLTEIIIIKENAKRKGK